MAGLIVSAVAKWNGSALKKGQKDITAFQRATLNLAKSFAIAFSAQKIYAFGKASVKAFAADEKAAKSLQVALKNTGNGFATIATEGFISRMQQTYKVLDDELRPAFQTLLTATGSLTASQKGLELALNISAGTGKDLQTVALALSKAYSGQTTALSKLGAGISAATIKSGDMNKIIAELTSKFQGQALAATKTYAGQMAALGVAAQNSKEIIGKGLLDSIAALGGNDGVSKTASAMETLSQNISDAILGMSLLIAKAKELGGINLGPNTGKFAELLASTLAGAGIGAAVGGVGAIPGAALGLTAGLTGQALAASGKSNREANTPYSGTSMYFTDESAERAKNTAIIKKNNATLIAAQKLSAAELAAKNKAAAQQASLDELKKKFDVNRINLETALLNSKDDAEKARIQSLLTIMDEDANSAAKRLAELDDANAAKIKAEQYAADTLKYLAQEADRAAKGLASIGNPNGIYPSGTPYDPRSGNTPDSPVRPDMGNGGDIGNPNGIYDYTAANPSFTYSTPIEQNKNIEAPNGSEEYLTDAVKRAMQKLNRYGDSTTFAGAL
jgi:hypothetical protein